MSEQYDGTNLAGDDATGRLIMRLTDEVSAADGIEGPVFDARTEAALILLDGLLLGAALARLRPDVLQEIAMRCATASSQDVDGEITPAEYLETSEEQAERALRGWQ